jgi:3-isopropylmalate/(R)-2-methylmalate dehydratase large subunit
MGHDRRGIVHVIGPELGLTQPGKTIVCGDSHTSTHGAFGALAFGIGTTEVEHVMATQCLLEGKAKNFKVDFNGKLRPGVTAKDAVLKLISRIGVAGGAGHVIEYTGSGMADLDMDGRMTICNMSIEAGARAGLLAPDQTTYNYMTGRPYAPSGKDWDAAMERWSALVTDDGAVFDRAETIDTAALEPMISFGTNPAMCAEIGTTVPDPEKPRIWPSARSSKPRSSTWTSAPDPCCRARRSTSCSSAVARTRACRTCARRPGSSGDAR